MGLVSVPWGQSLLFSYSLFVSSVTVLRVVTLTSTRSTRSGDVLVPPSGKFHPLLRRRKRHLLTSRWRCNNQVYIFAIISRMAWPRLKILSSFQSLKSPKTLLQWSSALKMQKLTTFSGLIIPKKL